MVRLALGLLLLLLAVVAIWALLPERKPTRPSVADTNAQWASYYRNLAEQARRSGDDASAVEYESLARTYGGLDVDE